MVTENIDNVLEYVQRIYSLEKDIKYIGGVEGGFLAQNYIIGKKDKKYFLKRYRQEEKIDINKVHNSKFFYCDFVRSIICLFGSTFQKCEYFSPFISALYISPSR